jgi:hypothetical protein
VELRWVLHRPRARAIGWRARRASDRDSGGRLRAHGCSVSF